MSTPNPTPNATATPRTDAQPLIKIYDRAGMPYDSELVSPDFARTLERELAAAKAEAEHWKKLFRLLSDEQDEDKARAEADNAALRAEVERLKIAGVAAIEAASKYGATGYYDNVNDLKAEFGGKGTIAIFESLRTKANEADQLRARVAELEAVIDNARSLAYGAPELNMSNYDHEQVRQLNDAMCEVFTTLDAAIDAARAGKGAT